MCPNIRLNDRAASWTAKGHNTVRPWVRATARGNRGRAMAGVFFFYRGPELFGRSLRIAHTQLLNPPSLYPQVWAIPGTLAPPAGVLLCRAGPIWVSHC